MIGDQPDMVSRLKDVLPLHWFPDTTPVLDGLLNGLAWAWAALYALIDYARGEARISTASGVWLDIIARDFFGERLKRPPGQGDDLFRNRIQRDLIREHGTRASVISALLDLTGRSPQIFEPANPMDTGGYHGGAGLGGGVAYGAAGGWGNLNLPFQCFITAYRPSASGIAWVTGWCGDSGGYGVGSAEYASLSMIGGQVKDSDINAAIVEVLPVSVIGWTCITN